MNVATVPARKLVRLTPQQRIGAMREALEGVRDPEIPPLSIVELGMVAGVEIEGGRMVVSITPTFVACPAVDVIRREARDAAVSIGEHDAQVRIVFDPPWTSDRITLTGRRKLKEFGLAPPGTGQKGDPLVQIQIVRCPFCESLDTQLESPFGPTLCRSIHYCHHCRQSFEHFKPVGE